MSKKLWGVLLLAVCLFLLCTFFFLKKDDVRLETMSAPGTENDFTFLEKTPAAQALAIYDGKEFFSNFTLDGATKGNALWEQNGIGKTQNDGRGGLAIESQRNAYDLIAAGILLSGAEQETLLDRGLKGIEWGLAQQGNDGSFPEEGNALSKKSDLIHPKSEFLYAATRSVLLIRESNVSNTYTERANLLIPKILLSAEWMANSADLTSFWDSAKNTNQRFFIATALAQAGTLGGASLSQKSAELIDFILGQQTADGTFPENNGFDASYQTVSLELLGEYILTLPPGEKRTALLNALQKGTDRFLKTVDHDGAIDTSQNTRTVACGEAIPGPQSKGKNIDIMPFRIYYMSYLLAQSSLGTIAESLENKGQGFDHSGDCLGDASY